MEIFEFEKLRIYQKALDFIDKVYEVTRKFPAMPKQRELFVPIAFLCRKCYPGF
jgi:hypothetical protein